MDDGVFLPVLREDDPPCDQCPRKGPENEQRLKLTTRNYQAFELYQKLKATQGAYRIPEHLASCPLFAENMVIVESAIQSGRIAAEMRAHERPNKKQDD